MRIIHLLWGLRHGGIETMVINIANEQSRLGNTVALIAIDRDIDERLTAHISPTVELHLVNRPKASHNPWYIFKLNKIIRDLNADVIHFHGVNMPRLVYKRFVKKWCTTHHTTWRKELRKFFSKDLHLLTISNKAAEDIFANTKIQAHVVVNGIPTHEYAHRKLQQPGEVFKIAQIGRLNLAIKGQDLTIKAAKILKNKGANIHIDLIGEGNDLPLIKQMIKEQQLESTITILGSKPQEYLKAHLQDYDLLVQPSRIEGFGLTIVEAMAAKVAVAVADLPPLIEVIDNGRCGLSFKADNEIDLANTIEAAMNDFNLERIQRASERAEKVYDVTTTARNYLNLYAKL